MEKVNVIGYYYDTIEGDYVEQLKYNVVFENSSVDGSKTWLEGYNVIDGHFEVKDIDWLIEGTREISKEEYIKGTKGWFTYPEYL